MKGHTILPRKQAAKKKNQEFYAKVLDQAEKLDFESASGLEGIDEEIKLLRVKIKSLAQKEPDNLRLILEATNVLTRLVRTNYKITGKQKKGLKEAIQNVLKNYALPLGAAIISKKL